MKITVLGCGRWGAFHAWYASSLGHEVTLWGRESSKHLHELEETRRNEFLTLPEDVKLTYDLKSAIDEGELCVISISAQHLRDFVAQIARLKLSPRPLILCMKGLEATSGKRLSVIVEEVLGSEWETVIWVGPGHVQDFVRGVPNCMVMSSKDEALTRKVIDVFTGPLIRFYYSEDLIGTEIGAAAKNVVGLAAGMLDGLGYTSLKGALMSRGTSELSRLIVKLGGKEKTVYGLSHLGDYEATLFSPFSNNRRYGENFIGKKATVLPTSKLAEGVSTSIALRALAKEYDIDLPICRTVCDIICDGRDPKEALQELFLRSMKAE